MTLRSKPSCTARPVCRTARGAARVRQLQEAAAEMFLSCGYEGVSVDGLIHRVGGSRRNVYGVYGGKEGLFVATVRSICDEISAQLGALQMDAADTAGGLQLYGQRLLELLLQPRMLAIHRLMVAEGARFPEQAHALCSNGRDRAAAALGQWFAVRQARGELRAELDGTQLAQRYIDLIVAGPQLRAAIGQIPPGWTPEAIRQHVQASVDLFLRGASVAAASNQGEPTP